MQSSSAAVAAAGGGGETSTGGFSVLIVAWGPLPLTAAAPGGGSASNGGGVGGGVVYAVAVAQPVQSWTVVRSHHDFHALSQALSPVLRMLLLRMDEHGSGGETKDETNAESRGLVLPPFPSPPQHVNALLSVRNELQQWLSSMLMHASVRESTAIQQFLTLGANTIPHQYDGVVWTQLNTLISPSSPEQGRGHVEVDASVAIRTAHAHTNQSSSNNNNNTGSSSSQLDMDMDYMFLGEDDGSTPHHEDEEDDDDEDNQGGHHAHHLHPHGNGEEDDDDDEDYVPAASMRYKPTEEDVADEDEMDIMQYAGEVEMIEDIGSLAQSLGASHLGRSLQLQAERNHPFHGTSVVREEPATHQPPQQQGIKMGAVPPPSLRGSGSGGGVGGGGIGSAMANAMNQSLYNTNSAQQHRPLAQSAPRLDSFKMLKVIGKGSFGKNHGRWLCGSFLRSFLTHCLSHCLLLFFHHLKHLIGGCPLS